MFLWSSLDDGCGILYFQLDQNDPLFITKLPEKFKGMCSQVGHPDAITTLSQSF